MYRKLLPLWAILLLSLGMTSCQTTLSFAAPIDPNTPKGKVMLLKKRIVTLENSMSNSVKNGIYSNVMVYLERMAKNIEEVKKHVDKKFHAELDAVAGLYRTAIKDYKKTKSYLFVDNKFKRGKKKLRKSYKKIMVDFDQKKSAEKVKK